MIASPSAIQRWLDENLYRFDQPVQYLGTEPNAWRKPWGTTDVRWLIAASWPYEQAAGNSSIPAVYKAINLHDEDGYRSLADRFYLPATPRDLRTLERHGIPVFGIEQKREALDFDVFATSISYQVLMISWLKMLAISGIPRRWAERTERAAEFPMIMVGGQSFGAPEALAPVVDCWWLGEVEDEPTQVGIAEVSHRIAQMKDDGLWAEDRIEAYAALAREFNFLYFPRFVDVHYRYEDRGLPHPSKVVDSFEATIPDLPMPFRKRHVKDMNDVVPLDDPPLLYSDPHMGAGDIEVGRGCPAWCSFCALTYRQKPYRQRSVPYMVETAKKLMENTGAFRLTPFSPDFPMHTERKKLIAALLEEASDTVDSPAMRVDDFIADNDYILLQVHGGMDTVTLGVEGNSQRMRDLVGKGCSDEDIKEAVTRGIRAGIRRFKLFMISGMPGEDEGDIFRILKLARDLADIRENLRQPNVRIQFSWTPLLIEANTPFQWFPVVEYSKAYADMWENFNDIKIDFKLGSKGEPNKMAFFQLCQRASREVGEAIVDLCEEINEPGKGGCWGGVPKWTKQRLQELLVQRGFLNGYDDCFDERDHDDLFGWEFIDQGVSKEMLWSAYVQMREFVEQTDSHSYDDLFDPSYHGNEWIERCDTRCYGRTCGVCDPGDLKLRRDYIQAGKREETTELAKVKVIDQSSVAMKLRVRLFKEERLRFVGNDHWRFAMRRAAYKATANQPYTIAKKTIRFATDNQTYRDWTFGTDYVEFGLTGKSFAVERLLAEMNRHLDGLVLGDWIEHPAKAPAITNDVDLSLWQLEIDADPPKLLKAIDQWRDAEYVKLVLKTADTSYFQDERREVNAKDLVDDLWLVRDGHTLKLKMLVRGEPSPYVVYSALMGQASWIDAARYAAKRLDVFTNVPGDQYDFLRPFCEYCGCVIPVNLFDQAWSYERCPRCEDVGSQVLVE